MSNPDATANAWGKAAVDSGWIAAADDAIGDAISAINKRDPEAAIKCLRRAIDALEEIDDAKS